MTFSEVHGIVFSSYWLMLSISAETQSLDYKSVSCVTLKDVDYVLALGTPMS